MVCKNVEEYTTEYGKVADEIKNICTNRACTLGAVQKTLEERGLKVGECALLAMISQIEGMVTFSKYKTYDAGDVITYKKSGILDIILGMVSKSEIIANLLVEVSYREFYLYDLDRYKDTAFKEHIKSKLEFEVHEKNTIKCTTDLEVALEHLNIPMEKWGNYVFIKEYTDKVYCMEREIKNEYNSKKYLGRLVKRT